MAWIFRHANWIEYLARRDIKIREKKDRKTGETFLSLSKPIDSERLKRKIINHLLRDYADADSINRAIDDYRFENKLDEKKLHKT